MERRSSRGDVGRWPLTVGRHTRRPANGQRSTVNQSGFTLAGVLVLLSVMMIFVAYTVPRQWSAVLQRDREMQTIWAMKQYARACYEFQKKNNTYPVNPDQLKQARSPRFIRGVKSELVDPLTGEVDWLVIPQAAAPNPNAPTVPVPPPGPTPSTTGTSSTNPQQKPSLPGVPIKDYAGGPFVGVRPPISGKAMLVLNGNDTYETWIYTALNLQPEIQSRMAGLQTVWK